MNGTCSNLSLCSTQFLLVLAVLLDHRSLKRRNCSKGLLQLRVTDLTLEFFVKRKEKATQLMELLLLLPPRSNCNFLVCIHVYMKVREVCKASRTNRWQNREVSSYEPEIPVASVFEGKVRNDIPTEYTEWSGEQKDLGLQDMAEP